MRSLIFEGDTTHARHRPREHAFSYRMFWLALDLDELAELDRKVAWFGHNRGAPVAIDDADYGGPGRGGIRDKILERVGRSADTREVERITLVTIPRVAGYVFNPVSFYLCRDAGGSVTVLVAEVRNTFGEMHHYVLEPAGTRDDALVFRTPKRFYVSPFFDVSGDYEIRLVEGSDAFRIGIQLREDDALVFSATMSGRGAPLTSARLRSTLCRLPLFAATIMLRIHWHAVLLHFRRGLRTHAKPAPAHPSTIPTHDGSIWYRLRARLVGSAGRPRRVAADQIITSRSDPR